MEDELEMNQLIDKILSGNKEMFGELYEKTIKDVYKTIHFLLEEKTNVDDVVQETYLQVYKYLSKFDRNRTFKPWITGIAIKQIHTYRRKRWMLLRIIKKARVNVQVPVMDTTNKIIDKISNDKLVDLVNQLPYKLKVVVILHYLNEHSQEDVAKILDIPLGTVKSRINASLKKLRQKGNDHNIFFGEVRNVQ